MVRQPKQSCRFQSIILMCSNVVRPWDSDSQIEALFPRAFTIAWTIARFSEG